MIFAKPVSLTIDLREVHCATYWRARDRLTEDQRTLEAVYQEVPTVGELVLGIEVRLWREKCPGAVPSEVDVAFLVQCHSGALIGLDLGSFYRLFERETLNNEIRVFLSSTFRDMQHEREYLTTHVFPQVRAYCARIGVHFSEIDLRWGITEEEARQGSVPTLCLNEIARARDSIPFFIGFLGERYGWAPPLDVVHAALGAQDGYVRDRVERVLADADRTLLSVTELEFLVGPLLDGPGRQHSLLYLRAHALTAQFAAASGEQAIYCDEDRLAVVHLERLKSTLRQAGAVRLDGYAEVAEFGEDVRRMLIAAASQLKGALGDPAPARIVARRYGVAAVKTEAIHAALDAFLSAPSNGKSLLLLSGATGAGKSTVLCSWVGRMEGTLNLTCVSHYFGHEGDHDMTAMMRKVLIATGMSESALTRWEPLIYLHKIPVFLSALKNCARPLLIVLDGIDRVEEEARNLGWMPTELSAEVHLVCSSSDMAQRDWMVRGGVAVMEVPPWTLEQAQYFITTYLAPFGKRLSRQQITVLLQAPMVDNPRFLRLVLDELRYGALFEQLDEHIAQYVQCVDLVQAYGLTLAHWREKLQRSDLFQPFDETMQILASLREGIEEPELQTMLKLIPLDLSCVLGMAQAHFDRLDGRICLPDPAFRQAIRARYWPDEETEIAFRARFVSMLPNASDDFSSREYGFQVLRILDPTLSLNYAERRDFAIAALSSIDLLLGIVKRVPIDLARIWGCLGMSGGREDLDARWTQEAKFYPLPLAFQKIVPWLLGMNIARAACAMMCRRLLNEVELIDDMELSRTIRLWLVQALSFDRSQLAEAVHLGEQLCEELEGIDDHETGVVLANAYFRLGTALAHQGNMHHAIEFLRRSVASWQLLLQGSGASSRNHAEAAQAQERLGQMLLDTGKVVEALTEMSIGRDILCRCGDGHMPQNAILSTQIAELLLRTGRPKQALPLLEECLVIMDGLDRTAFPEDWNRAVVASQLAKKQVADMDASKAVRERRKRGLLSRLVEFLCKTF